MDQKPRSDDQNNAANGDRVKDSNLVDPGRIGQGSQQNESEQPRQQTKANEDDAHILRQLFGGLKAYEWVSIVLQFLLFGVGVAYAFYAAKQWDAMRKALEKTDTAIEQTQQALELNRRALDLNRRQTVAAETSANAANASVNIAGASLESSAKSFQVDQRPYLIAGTPQFNPPGPIVNQSVTIRIGFQNVGKSAAIRIRGFRHLALRQGNDSSPDDADDAGRIIIDGFFADARHLIEHPGAHDVAPGASLYIDGRDLPPLSAAQILSIQRGNASIYFVGGVDYLDSFKIKHTTEFCEAYTGLDLTTWRFCPTHNTIR